MLSFQTKPELLVFQTKYKNRFGKFLHVKHPALNEKDNIFTSLAKPLSSHSQWSWLFSFLKPLEKSALNIVRNYELSFINIENKQKPVLYPFEFTHPIKASQKLLESDYPSLTSKLFYRCALHIIRYLRRLKREVNHANNNYDIFDQAFVKASLDKPPHQSTTAQYISELNSFMANGVRCHINLEMDPFRPLLNEHIPTIVFIAPHDYPPHDIKMAKALIAQLYEQYSHALISKIPMPRVIIGKELVQAMPPILQKIYLKYEACPVNSTPIPTQERYQENYAILKKLDSEFIENKSLIFVMPEGTRRVHSQLSYPEKFQHGLSKRLVKALQKNVKVRFLPVGVNWDKNKESGSIYIGKAVIFTKNKEGLLFVQQPDLGDPEFFALPNSLQRFKNSDNYPLVYSDKHLQADDTFGILTQLISGIVVSELAFCMQKAKTYPISN